jgi:hypothetical protein
MTDYFFNPFQHRKDVLEKYRDSNEKAQETIFQALKDGHSVREFGRLNGPYTNHVTYHISNGEFAYMVEPASLHWVDLSIIGGRL